MNILKNIFIYEAKEFMLAKTILEKNLHILDDGAIGVLSR